MLFLNQIRKDFQQVTWKKGQVLFHEDAVKQVRLKNNLVTSQVLEPSVIKELPCRTTILVERGSIRTSSCSCSTHGAYEKHCRHVAALANWVLSKGSLLRSGILESPRTLTDSPQTAKPYEIPSTAVAFVRAIYEGKVLTKITVEPAIRFRHEDETRVYTFQKILRKESNLWKTTDDLTLEVKDDFVPMLLHLTAQKQVLQGPSMLEGFSKILVHDQKDRIVLHDNLNVIYDPDPLKIQSLHVGEKTAHGRRVTYEYKNTKHTIGSEDLERMKALGHLSDRFCLKDGYLLKFEKSLRRVAQFANRTGILKSDGTGVTPIKGYSQLEDDEEYPLHPLSVYRLSLELGVDDFTVDPDWKDFFEWKKTFERKSIPSLPKVDYGFDLRDYQKNGVEWVWSLHHRGLAALLADDMGLGKTHQVLAILSSFYRVKTGKALLPTLVIAPTSVVSAWIQKLEKYPTQLKWSVFHGKGRILPEKDIQIVLTTYGILQRESSLREKEWHCVVLDEAQAIKNSITISSRASRVLRSKFRVAMTGTPIENHATDLWSIMEFLLPGYLGPLPRFKRLYSSSSASKEPPDESQAESLKRLISPFLLRRTKGQVLKELPEKTEEIISCELTATQKKIYKSYLESSEANRAREDLETGKKINYANILSVLTRLKQVCDHPRLPALVGEKVKSLGDMDPWESGKWVAFDELISEALGSNLKVVVFTQYLGMLDLMGLWLKDRGVGYSELRGDTSDRKERIRKFTQDPDCKIFLCSLLAGSLGIDLTAGSVCIHFDRWWNPARENQATDRLHRLGQTRGVQVFKLQIPGTIEDRIAKIIQSKSILSDQLIEQSSMNLNSFSRQELMSLLSANFGD